MSATSMLRCDVTLLILALQGTVASVCTTHPGVSKWLQFYDSLFVRLMRYRRLPPRLNSVLPSSGLLRGVDWLEEERFLDSLTLEGGTDR